MAFPQPVRSPYDFRRASESVQALVVDSALEYRKKCLQRRCPPNCIKPCCRPRPQPVYESCSSSSESSSSSDSDCSSSSSSSEDEKKKKNKKYRKKTTKHQKKKHNKHHEKKHCEEKRPCEEKKCETLCDNRRDCHTAPIVRREQYIIHNDCNGNNIIGDCDDKEKIITAMSYTYTSAINPTSTFAIPAVTTAVIDTPITGWTLQSIPITNLFEPNSGIIRPIEPGDYKVEAVFNYVITPLTAVIVPPAIPGALPYIGLQDISSGIDLARSLFSGDAASIDIFGQVVFNVTITVTCGQILRFHVVDPIGGIAVVGGATITFNSPNGTTTLNIYKVRETPQFAIRA